MSTQVDALIVGAGPTGLTLGLCLLKQGKSVLIAEKHLAGLDFSRAILINSDTLLALAPYGVSQHLQAAGVAVDGFTMHVNNRPISQVHFKVDELDLSHPVCLPQLKTEAILTECFLNAGGQIIRGYEFSAQQAHETDGAWHSTLPAYHGDADDVAVQSQWLLGCDGFHSAVRTKLGIEFPGSSLAARPYAVDLELSHWPFETNVNVYMDQDGGCLAVQIGHNHLRLVTATAAQRDAFMQSLPIKQVTWDSTFDVHFHVAQRYGQDRAWLAGDAAHVHSPVGGRGMNMGILDAVTLAGAVESGDLNGYAYQRHQAAKQWVDFNQRISTIALEASASSRRTRKLLTSVLPLVGKMLGPRLASTAFSRLSSSRLERAD